MIVDERFTTYLRSLDTPEIDYIADIEQEALQAYVPIIRKDTQSFMKFLMQTLQPETILEVGTAVGFSALLMEAYNPKACDITTIENYEPDSRGTAEFSACRQTGLYSSVGRGCTGDSSHADPVLRFYIYGCSQGTIPGVSAVFEGADAFRQCSGDG